MKKLLNLLMGSALLLMSYNASAYCFAFGPCVDQPGATPGAYSSNPASYDPKYRNIKKPTKREHFHYQTQVNQWKTNPDRSTWTEAAHLDRRRIESYTGNVTYGGSLSKTVNATGGLSLSIAQAQIGWSRTVTTASSSSESVHVPAGQCRIYLSKPYGNYKSIYYYANSEYGGSVIGFIKGWNHTTLSNTYIAC